jgi:hypothetical protein
MAKLESMRRTRRRLGRDKIESPDLECSSGASQAFPHLGFQRVAMRWSESLHSIED